MSSFFSTTGGAPFLLPENDLNEIVSVAGCDLLALQKQSVFITGGTGFIGSWLVESLLYADTLLSLGITMRLLTRRPDRFLKSLPHLAQDPRVSLVAGDVRSFQYDGEQYGMVIHSATDASAQLNAEDPLQMADTIVEGTRRVLEITRLSGASRLLMLSSGGVYGKFMPGVTHVREDCESGPDQMNPYYTYSESKRMAELLCVLYAKQYGLHVSVARIFALVGPRLPLDVHFAAGNFIRDALAGGPIHVAGDGMAVRSYLYASDLVVWLLTLLVRGSSARAYNVGSDHAVTIRQLAEAVVSVCPKPIPIELTGTPDASNPVNYYVPEITRATNELGLRVKTPLSEALSRTIAWHRRNKH